MRKSIILLALVLLVMTGCKQEFADTVVYGTIRTAEEECPEAEALAVKDGRYVYVGDEAGVAAYIEDGVTKVVSTWFEGEKGYQAGSEKNPWKVGKTADDTVFAYTNGTDRLVVRGLGGKYGDRPCGLER